jgi:hypothetical protein
VASAVSTSQKSTLPVSPLEEDFTDRELMSHAAAVDGHQHVPTLSTGIIDCNPFLAVFKYFAVHNIHSNYKYFLNDCSSPHHLINMQAQANLFIQFGFILLAVAGLDIRFGGGTHFQGQLGKKNVFHFI